VGFGVGELRTSGANTAPVADNLADALGALYCKYTPSITDARMEQLTSHEVG